MWLMAITARIIGGDTLLLRCFYVLFTAFTDFYGINNKQILCIKYLLNILCLFHDGKTFSES